MEVEVMKKQGLASTLDIPFTKKLHSCKRLSMPLRLPYEAMS